MITSWIRLDKRPRHVALGRWDTAAETPAEVLERYAREKGSPLLLWSTGELSGGCQGERRLAWPAVDYPLGVVAGRIGKGQGVLLEARSTTARQRALVVLSCDRFDAVVLDWMLERRRTFAPLFPDGVLVEPTDEESG